MGWSESRAVLLSPRWRSEEIEQAVKRPAWNGGFVRVFGNRRDEAATAAPIPLAAVKNWLQTAGFTPEQESWIALRRDDALAELFERDGELSEVLLTFTLAPDSPQRWPAWRKLVEGLSAAFGVRLTDRATGASVSPDQLLVILSRSAAWPDFRDQFHWPDLSVPDSRVEIPAPATR